MSQKYTISFMGDAKNADGRKFIFVGMDWCRENLTKDDWHWYTGTRKDIFDSPMATFIFKTKEHLALFKLFVG